jgi:crossover junction endodeoxyribonuclease RusA
VSADAADALMGIFGMKRAGRTVQVWLPWPPSVNHYWGTRGKSRYIGAKGKAYRLETLSAWNRLRVQGFGHARLHVAVQAFPPDRRARDLDNLAKCPIDALMHARAYADDSQIDRLLIERGEVRKGDAGLLVTITG